jgi:hypothetical protein
MNHMTLNWVNYFLAFRYMVVNDKTELALRIYQPVTVPFYLYLTSPSLSL